MQNLKPSRQLLFFSNSITTGPLWAYSLEQRNFSVIRESIPVNTVQFFIETTPDLVILDVTLPEGELSNLIKKLRIETVVPILFLTHNKGEEFLLKLYEAGVDECILKPIGPSLFHAKIDAWLGVHGLSLPIPWIRSGLGSIILMRLIALLRLVIKPRSN